MIKIKNIGFSLIELLITLGIISALSIAAIFIYNKVSVSQKVKVLSEDMSYSHTEYNNALNIYPMSSFQFNDSYKRYDMSPAIQSNFQQIGKVINGTKKYRSNIGNEVNITPNQQQNDYTKPHLLTYSIKKHVDKDICINLAMNNIKNTDSILIVDAYYIYINNKNILTGGNPKKIATLKSISDACSNKKQDGMTFFYPVK